MAPRRTLASSSPAPRKPDFERYKHIIEKPYLKQRKSRKEVSEYMRSQHEFEATKSQYEEAFRRWGWTKNIPSHVWDKVYQYQLGYDTEFEVFYYTEKIEDDKVQRELRKRRSVVRLNDQAASLLPSGVAVLLRPLDMTWIFHQQLPIGRVISCFTSSDFDIFLRPLESRLNYRSNVITKELVASSLLEHLKAIFVPSNLSQTSTKDTTHGNAFQTYKLLYQQVLLSLANNFAGLKRPITEVLMQHLASEAFLLLKQAIDYIPTSLATKAIIHNLFRKAVEFGHADMVEYCLRYKNASIDIDNCIPIDNGRFVTPLELASMLQHRKVVEILLEHKADVHKTYQHEDDIQPRGALHYMINPVTISYSEDSLQPSRTNKTRLRLNSTIFEMLLDAGAKLTLRLIASVLADHSYLVLPMLRRRIGSEHIPWIESGLLLEVMAMLDSASCLEIIEICLEIGIDLNHVPKRMLYPEISGTYRWTERSHSDILKNAPIGDCRMIDIACVRGQMQAAQLLIENNAILGRSTIPNAITSGNRDLIRMLLRSQGSHFADNAWRYNVLSSVVRLGEDGQDVFNLLLEFSILQPLFPANFCSSELSYINHSSSACTIQFLSRHGVEFDNGDLAFALAKAIRDGHREAAKTLINLGIDVNLNSRDQNSIEEPLTYAIQKVDFELFSMLLDAEAKIHDFYLGAERSANIPLVFAIRHCDLSIVQQLLDVGVVSSNRRVLIAAVEQQDLKVVEMLLRAGAKLDTEYAIITEETPLSTAVELGNFQMVRYLLENGASYHDDVALLKAVQQCREILDLLLSTYNKSCPLGHVEYGLSTLEYAIEKGDAVLFRYLLEHGLKVSTQMWCWNPFFTALQSAQRGDFRFLEAVLDHGISPNAAIIECSVVSNRQIEYHNVQKSLVPLFLAAIDTGSVDIVKYFIKRNANVNLSWPYAFTQTPLQRAAELGHYDIVQMLIHANADINGPAAAKSGGTAIQFAAIGGYNAIIRLLLSYGADVNAPPSKGNGRTVLEGAAEYGRLDTVQILLNAGAAHNGTDLRDIDSAIRYASKNGHAATAELLRNFRATKQRSEMFGVERYETEMDLIES